MITALRQQTGSVAWRIPFAETLGVPLVWNNGWLLAATTPVRCSRSRGRRHIDLRREISGGLRAQPVVAADRTYLSPTLAGSWRCASRPGIRYGSGAWATAERDPGAGRATLCRLDRQLFSIRSILPPVRSRALVDRSGRHRPAGR